MLTKEVKVSIPQDVYISLNETEDELQQKLRMFLAVRAYRLGKLTLGKAAQLSGMSRLQFENFLADNLIPISLLTVEDVYSDLQKLGI
jgi:predicted HTH domain antitoxin